MSKSETSLSTVQDLYALQVQLWSVLDARTLSPVQRDTARRNLRAFSALLRRADWQVMGGEDVFLALKQMQTEVARKLKGRGSISKKPSVRARATKRRKR